MADEAALQVGFEVDLSDLNSGVQGVGTVLEGLSSVADDAGAALSESMSMPESSISSLMDLLSELNTSISGLTSSVDEVASGMDEGFKSVVDSVDAVGSSVDEAVSSIDAGFSDMSTSAQESADQIAESMSGVDDSVSQAGDSVHQSGSLFSGGLMGMAQQAFMTYMSLQGLGQGAMQLASSLLDPAAQAEQTGMAFDTLLGSARKASAFLSQLNTFAARTPFQTDQVNQAAEKMVAFGFKTQDVIPNITAIGDALSSLGKTSGADLNSIVDIFGKIRAEGKLTGGTMMELSRWGIPAWQLLSEATGKSIPVLQQMVSKGLIPAKDAIADLTTGIEKSPFGGGMARQATTLNGQISTFVSNMKLAWDALLGVQGGQVVKGSLFDTIETGLGTVGGLLASSQFQQGAAKLGTEISGALSQIGKAVGGADFSGFKTDLSDIWAIFQDLGGIVGTVASNLEQFASGVLDAANNSGDIQTVLQAIHDILPDVDAFLNAVGTDLNQNVLPPLEQLITDVENTVANFAQWLDKSGTAKSILSDLCGVIGGLSTVAGTLVGWLGWLINDMNQGGIAGTALKVALIGIGGVIATMKVVEFGKDAVSAFNSARDAASNLLNNIGNIKDKASDVLDFFKSKFGPDSKKAVDDVGSEADTTAGKVESIGTKAKDAESDVSSAAKSEETSLENVGTTADTTAGDVESIGTDAVVAEGEIKTASTEMEGELGGVGATSGEVSTAEEGIGTAATGAEGTVAGAAASMMVALAPLIAAIGNIQQFQAEANGPLPYQQSWQDNLKNSGLNGIFPAGGIGEGYNAFKQLTGWHGFASGGSNIPEGDYLVGEQGPEIMRVPGGSTIYPSAQTYQMLSNGGNTPAPIHIHNHIYIDGQEMTDFVGQRMISMMSSVGSVRKAT